MQIRLIIILLFGVFILSSKNQTQKIEAKQSVDTVNYIRLESPKIIDEPQKTIKPLFEKYIPSQIDSNDVIFIDKISAIYLLPNKEEIAYLKGKGEGDFYTIADDNMFYMANGIELLKKQRIEIVTTDKRYIVFKREWNGKDLVYDSKLDTGWALIFNHPYSDPEKVDFIIENEIVESYFGKLYWRVDNFIDSLYSREIFKIEKKNIQFKNFNINFIQLEEKEYKDRNSIACRSWLYILNGNDTIDFKYYKNIEAVGGWAGIDIQEVQPLSDYFIASKFGDYEGELLLIDKSGKINTYSGGRYCLSKDKKNIFSKWNSDISGITIIDVKTGNSIFEKELMFYFQNIYEFNNEYYLIDSDIKNKSEGVYKFDFVKKDFIKINDLDKRTLVKFNKVDFADSKEK